MTSTQTINQPSSASESVDVAKLNKIKKNVTDEIDSILTILGDYEDLTLQGNLRTAFDNHKSHLSLIKKQLNNLTDKYDLFFIEKINNSVSIILKNTKLKKSEKSDSNLREILDSTSNLATNTYSEMTQYTEMKKIFRSFTFEAIANSLKDVEVELSSYRRLRNIADTSLTENIYNTAVKKYKKLEKKYRKYFYRSVAVVLLLSFVVLLSKSGIMKFLNMGDVEFWILKTSILVIGVTLISYFLKQSSHYQKLADQNYQTQVELQAYPSFMEIIPASEAVAIRKELALKYFGRELDGSTHKDISNLISDQMKTTTELVKTTTTAIKNLKQ